MYCCHTPATVKVTCSWWNGREDICGSNVLSTSCTSDDKLTLLVIAHNNADTEWRLKSCHNIHTAWLSVTVGNDILHACLLCKINNEDTIFWPSNLSIKASFCKTYKVRNKSLILQFMCNLPPFHNFVNPYLPVSFWRDTKSRWSLLSGIYARKVKQSHAGSN